MPIWLSTLYIDGLKDQGIIGGDKSTSSTPDAGRTPGKPAAAPVDYSDAIPLPKGFQTRRAG